MPTSGAPYRGGIGEVVAREARHTYAPLSFLNDMDEPLNSLHNLVVVWRPDGDIQMARNDSQRRENHSMCHRGVGSGAIGARPGRAFCNCPLQFVFFAFLHDTAVR